MQVPEIMLNNGIRMPQFGLGVWQIEDGGDVVNAIGVALDAGYRAIDTASQYGNEEGVGKAIRQSGIPREDIFVTSKLWITDQGYDNTMRAFEASLRRLNVTYLDLYLIHWPAPERGQYIDSWRAMEELLQQGRIRAIGVSNFTEEHLDKLLGKEAVVPAVNQIELHPHMTQETMRDYCREHNIYVESWSPLKRAGNMLEDQVLQDIAERHDKTAAQVVLRWHIQHDLIAIPKSRTPERIRENIDIFDFNLSSDEMAAIDALNINDRIGPDPKSMNG